MTVPHYINEDKSDMRGIKSGWYAVEDGQPLFRTLFQPRGLRREDHSANERDDGV
jgi:hypothetical protein